MCNQFETILLYQKIYFKHCVPQEYSIVYFRHKMKLRCVLYKTMLKNCVLTQVSLNHVYFKFVYSIVASRRNEMRFLQRFFNTVCAITKEQKLVAFSVLLSFCAVVLCVLENWQLWYWIEFLNDFPFVLLAICCCCFLPKSLLSTTLRACLHFSIQKGFPNVFHHLSTQFVVAKTSCYHQSSSKKGTIFNIKASSFYHAN